MTKSCEVKQVCETCLEKVASFGYPCKLLLDEVCKSYRQSKPLTYSENHVSTLSQLGSVIKFLERKGYLITRETSRYEIEIYPNVINSIFIDGKYCWCLCERQL